MLQEPAVFHAFEVSRQVTNEAHSFREFIRFANISSGFSDPGLAYFPESQCADPGRSPFSDRLPSENWMILDDNRQLAVVHPADRPFYLTRLSPDEIERFPSRNPLRTLTKNSGKDFSPQLPSKSVPIPTVSVRICRSTTGIICRNLKIFRVLEFFQLFHVQHKHSTASCLGINRNRVISARAEVSAFHRGGRIGNCFPKPCFLF